MFWKGFNTNFDSLAIFSFKDMIAFVLNIPSKFNFKIPSGTLTSDTRYPIV